MQNQYILCKLLQIKCLKDSVLKRYLFVTYILYKNKNIFENMIDKSSQSQIEIRYKTLYNYCTYMMK